MYTINRMFLTQVLKVFALSGGGMISIMLLFEYFDLARSVGSRSPSFGVIFSYLLWTAPKYAAYALPLAVLVSTLVVLGMAAKDRELVALRAIGGSLRRATGIFVLLGLFWSVFSFFVAEIVVPRTSREADRIRDVEIMGRPSKVSFAAGRLWTRLDSGEIVTATALSGDEMKEISVFHFENGLTRRVEAREAVWTDPVWELRDVRIYEFGGERVRALEKSRYLLAELAGPKQLSREKRDPEDLSFYELRAYARNLARAGFRADKYWVNLYGKISQPMVCLAMALVGAALAVRQKRGGAMLAVGYAVGLIVLYWALHMLLISLGYSGRMAPLPAAWGAPGAFLAIGGWLFLRAEE